MSKIIRNAILSSLILGAMSFSALADGTPYFRMGIPKLSTPTNPAGGTSNGSLSITGSSNITVRSGSNLAESYSVSGASGSVTWTASNLPSGTSLSSSGTLSGSPSSTSTVNITASDSSGSTASQNVSITVLSSPSISLSSYSISGRSWNGAITASTSNIIGTPTYSIAQSNTLPSGLSFSSSSGSISGTVAGISMDAVTITVTDSYDGSTATSGTLYIDTTSALNVNAWDVTLAKDVDVSSLGIQPYTDNAVGSITYSVESGSLPTGLSMNSSTGQVTGIPTAAGNYTLKISAVDSSDGAKATTQTLTWGVFDQSQLSISKDSDVPSTVAISQYVYSGVSATGGTDPYTWEVTGDATIDYGYSYYDSFSSIQTGSVYFIVDTSTPGTKTFTVKVTDADGKTAQKTYTTEVVIPAFGVSSPYGDVMYNVCSGATGYIDLTGSGDYTISKIGGESWVNLTQEQNSSGTGIILSSPSPRTNCSKVNETINQCDVNYSGTASALSVSITDNYYGSTKVVNYSSKSIFDITPPDSGLSGHACYTFNMAQ